MQTRELDELDKYVIYRLQGDARTTSAAEIAEDYGVSPSTVRNRIAQLVEDGVVEGAPPPVHPQPVGHPPHPHAVGLASPPPAPRPTRRPLPPPYYPPPPHPPPLSPAPRLSRSPPPGAAP